MLTILYKRKRFKPFFIPILAIYTSVKLAINKKRKLSKKNLSLKNNYVIKITNINKPYHIYSILYLLYFYQFLSLFVYLENTI